MSSEHGAQNYDPRKTSYYAPVSLNHDVFEWRLKSEITIKIWNIIRYVVNFTRNRTILIYTFKVFRTFSPALGVVGLY